MMPVYKARPPARSRALEMCDKWFKAAKDKDEWHDLISAVHDRHKEETIRVLEKMNHSFMLEPIAEPDLALAVVEAVCDATKAHKQHCGVAIKGLYMLRLLQMRKHANGTRKELETVNTVLYEHALFNTDVREQGRNILLTWGWLGLTDIQITSLEEALAQAEQFQAQSVDAIKQKDIVECLYDFRHNAQWDFMTVTQQLHFRSQVVDFFLWCMKNYPPESSPCTSIGELACRLLLKLVAGCMQEDDNRLEATSRSYLVNLGVGPLWTLFSTDSKSDDVDFQWLAQRLVCAPVKQKKRVREADDSA